MCHQNSFSQVSQEILLAPCQKINITFFTVNQMRNIPRKAKFFLQFLIKRVNLGHFQDCFNTFTRIFHRILMNDGMIVFLQSLASFTLHYIFFLVCSCFIRGFGQMVHCVWRIKELTPKGEDVKLITQWKDVLDTIGQYFFIFP